MALSPQWLDELKARITLSSLVMRTTKLQRAGREWRACCPFHNEKSPSFYVNDEKGFYHCFGCQKHGGAIDWMIEQRGLEFMDAVKELAAEAGMELPAPDPRAARQAEVRASLHDVMQAAQDWFAANLHEAEGAKAREYLARRGVDAAAQAKFGFGYAPEDRQALTRALSRFEVPMLIEAGLLIEVEDKTPYARFRERLMLPIHDARGRVIAFGGRILDSRDGVAKYLNSPDTPLFDKGRTLYNLHRASPAARQSGRVIVVEGYMDVVALAAAGFAEAVAPMGTALTEAQIELLWRMAQTPILCLDGDAAGIRAARRAANKTLPMLRPGQSLNFVVLPDGRDPDDFLGEFGISEFQSLINNPTTMLDFIWDSELNQEPLKTPEQKAGFRNRLMEHVSEIRDKEISSLYRRDFLDLFYSFAYPRNERKWRPQGRFTEAISDELRQEIVSFANGGSKTKLAYAVAAGFAQNIHLLSKHIEDLLKLHPTDVVFSFSLDVLIEAFDCLENERPLPEMALNDIRNAARGAIFPFLKRDCPPELAEEALEQAVKLLIHKPEIDRAIQKLKLGISTDFGPDELAEINRLRTMASRYENDLREFARRWARDSQLDA
jgi:DNA primase